MYKFSGYTVKAFLLSEAESKYIKKRICQQTGGLSLLVRMRVLWMFLH